MQLPHIDQQALRRYIAFVAGTEDAKIALSFRTDGSVVTQGGTLSPDAQMLVEAITRKNP